MLSNILLVALGGAVGSAARYALGLAVDRALGRAFPYDTLAVNALGCLAIGLALPPTSSASPARLLLVTGALGGFTTFSAFGAQTHALFQRGSTNLALANIALNVLGCLACVALGSRLARAF